MPDKNQTEEGLEKEIAQLRELLRQAGEKMGKNPKPEELLAVLDSVARAAPQLAHLLKAQRELANAELDPAAVLRQALAELEEEWPELHECKEALRNGGTANESTGATEEPEHDRTN
jgi:hypothetical protein